MDDRHIAEAAQEIMNRTPRFEDREVIAARRAMDVYVPRPVLGKPFQMRIRSGCYDMDEPFDYTHFPNPMSLDVESDEIYVFRSDASKILREEISEFWNIRHQMAQDGLLHKRILTLHGPPGSGKTCLLKQEIAQMVAEDRVVFISHSPYYVQKSIKVFRDLEPDRDLTVVVEDIDELVRSWGTHTILEMFDGIGSTNHVLFIVTTNDMDKLPWKLKRPGRMDRKIFVGHPCLEHREEYFIKKMGDRVEKDQIRKMAVMTEGMGFAHLREVTASMSGYGRELEETIQRLRQDMITEDKVATMGQPHWNMVMSKCSDDLMEEWG